MALTKLRGRTLGLLLGAAGVAGLFLFVAMRSGPLAPVSVTVAKVESRSVTPSLFGVGLVEARYTYKVGPTIAARVLRVDVNVGDRVRAGQVLGDMDPVDLDHRVVSAEAALRRAEASLNEAQARLNHAQIQANRYQKSYDARATSEELLATKQNDLRVADAAFAGARQERERVSADRASLVALRDSLKLVAPVDGLVTQRLAEPGTTIVAGQSVVELVDPQHLWVNTRFDQGKAGGLASGLKAEIVLRSHGETKVSGQVARVEPLADSVTEEALAKIAFDIVPTEMPPLGELAEITIALRPAPAAPVVANAAIRRHESRRGVWKIVGDAPVFAPARFGASDLDGMTQVLDGVAAGEQIIVHSGRDLTPKSRLRIVESIGAAGR